MHAHIRTRLSAVTVSEEHLQHFISGESMRIGVKLLADTSAPHAH